jgi:hypothetical protein
MKLCFSRIPEHFKQLFRDSFLPTTNLYNHNAAKNSRAGKNKVIQILIGSFSIMTDNTYIYIFGKL